MTIELKISLYAGIVNDISKKVLFVLWRLVWCSGKPKLGRIETEKCREILYFISINYIIFKGDYIRTKRAAFQTSLFKKKQVKLKINFKENQQNVFNKWSQWFLLHTIHYLFFLSVQICICICKVQLICSNKNYKIGSYFITYFILT